MSHIAQRTWRKARRQSCEIRGETSWSCNATPQRNLQEILTPHGHRWHYEYQDVLMTAIADEHGHILLRNRYEYGVLVRQDYANGDVYDYAYLWSPTRTLADKVRVTLPDRSVREIWVADTVPGNLRTQ